jgi:hypothetical protein
MTKTRQAKFIPHKGFTKFTVQCFSPLKGLRGEWVDRINTDVKTFQEAEKVVKGMKECKSRIGIAKDDGVFEFPKALHFQPQE